MKTKQQNQPAQSARFIEAAKKAGVDGSGRKFAKVMRKIVRAKTSINKQAKP